MSKFSTCFAATGQKSLILLSFKAILDFFLGASVSVYTFFTHSNLASPASLEYKLALCAGLGQGLSSETVGLDLREAFCSASRCLESVDFILCILSNKFREIDFQKVVLLATFYLFIYFFACLLLII